MTPGQRPVATILLTAPIWQAAAPGCTQSAACRGTRPHRLNGTAALIRGTRH